MHDQWHHPKDGALANRPLRPKMLPTKPVRLLTQARKPRKWGASSREVAHCVSLAASVEAAKGCESSDGCGFGFARHEQSDFQVLGLVNPGSIGFQPTIRDPHHQFALENPLQIDADDE